MIGHAHTPQLMPDLMLGVADYLVLDCETADPPADVIDAHIERFMENWTPPGNVKAEDKIEARRQEAAQKIRDKAGLLDSAPVLCVAIKTDRTAVLFDAMVTDDSDRYDVPGWRVEWCGDEQGMLLSLRDWLDSYTMPDTLLAGHNINGFDVPKLRARYLAHRLRLPQLLTPGAENPRCDTMREYPRHSVEHRDQKFVSLDAVCTGLNIPRPKQVINGADCPRLYRDGEYAAIGTYCAIDVIATEQAVLLLTGQHPDFK